MKKILSNIILLSLLFITGCGHNIVCHDKGTGILMRIPLPDGNSLFQMKLGNIESSRAIIRGNSTYDILTSTGGQLVNSAGTTSRILLTSNIQLNQGNIRRILTSQNVSDQTKIILLKFLQTQKSPKTTPVTIKSVGTAGSTDKDSTKINAIKDEMIENTKQTINTVLPNITQGIVRTTNNVTNSFDNITKNLQLNYQIQKTLNYVCLTIFLFILLIIAITIFLNLFKNKKSE